MDIINYALQVKHWCNKLYGMGSMSHIDRFNDVISMFNSAFDAHGCCLCSSSGRVEIIGNHTDHNGGRVIACTIDRDILAGFEARSDNKVVIKSAGYKDIAFDIDDIDVKEVNSCGMAKGVMRGLLDRGYNVGGFNAVMTSNVPSGAGMSSSAAFQLLVGRILAYLYNGNNIDGATLAKIGQFAENTYFNKPCGLMDQGTIGIGGIVMMDFADGFVYEKVADTLDGYDLIVVNTGGSHANLTAEYASIPHEMKSVAELLGGQKLCHIAKDKFDDNYQYIVDKLGARPALRAKHYFEEVDRVVGAITYIAQGNWQMLIDTVRDSGLSSLNQLQNVTYPKGGQEMKDALDYSASIIDGSSATRVHGGGFAGTILLVVQSDKAKHTVSQLTEKYGHNNVFALKIRSVGASVLTLNGM